MAGLTNLKDLALYDSRVTDLGLSYLDKLTNLQSLVLHGTAVSDDGLMYLKKLGKLQHLTLYNSNVTLTGVRDLQRALPKANILFVSGPAYRTLKH